MATVIHKTKSDSKGYTRYFLDEPIGTGALGVLARGPKMTNHDGAEVEYEIVLHGQQVIDLPDEVTELNFGDGEPLKLGGKSS